MIDYDKSRLLGLGFTEETIAQLDFACWDTHKQKGMKKKGNRMVPNCVPKSEHREEKYDYDKDSPLNAMTARDLPAATVAGGGDEKNPQLSEGVPQTMPRMEVIKKNMNRDSVKAMSMPPNSNFAETEDFNDAFHSMEPNAGMAINQLRVMREKIDIMLGMLYPDDNLEPWCATKLAMCSQNLASVCDYLRFGAES